MTTETEAAEATQRLIEAFGTLTNTYRDETAEMRIRREAEEAGIAKSKVVKDSSIKAGATAVAALGNFSKALLSTEGGMSKYNSSLNTAGNAALDLGKALGPLGLAIGGLVKLFTMGMEIVAKQNDAMIKAYDTLSEFGQTAKLTTTDVLTLGRASGYTSHNLEIFTKNAVKVSQELAGLTGSASDGIVAFGKLTSITQEQRNQYNRLGQNQEKVTQLQTDYVRQTVNAGIALAKSPELMRKSSLAYIDSLNELAAITGVSVEKQQAAADIAHANENFNAYLFHKGQERDAIQKQANEATDDTTKKALQTKADEISQVIRVKEELGRTAVSFMSAGHAAATLQSIATDGKTVWTGLNQTMLMSQEGVSDWNDKLNKGESAIADMLTAQVAAARKFDVDFGKVGHAFGEHSIELQKVFGVDNKMRETAAAWAKLSTKEEKDAFIQKIAVSNKELESKKLGLSLEDSIKKTQNEQLTVELRARQAMDDFTMAIRGPVTGAFRGLLSVMNSFGKAVGKVISWIMPETGKKIMDQFKDEDDIKEEQSDLEKRSKAVAANIEKYKPAGERMMSAEAEQMAAYKERVAAEEKTKTLEKKPENLDAEKWKAEKEQASKDLATAREKEAKAIKESKEAYEAIGPIGLESYKNSVAMQKGLEAEKSRLAESMAKVKGKTIAEEPKKEKTVEDDPAVIESKKLLAAKQTILESKRDEALKQQFKEENDGQEYTSALFEAKYKTLHDKEEFKKKRDARLKPDEDAVAKLKEENGQLEKATQEKINAINLQEAKDAEEKYNKTHGVEASTTPAAKANTSQQRGDRGGTERFEGFGKETDTNIKDASKKFGMDEKTMRGFVKMEGGWTGAISKTGATGIGQFTQGTWNSLSLTDEGKEIGMKPIGKNLNTPADPRRDQRVNMMATALLAKNNAKLLEAAGVPKTGENLYMVHNIGPGVIDAIKGRPVGPKVIEAMKHNGMEDGQTPGDFVAMQKRKFNQHEQLANATQAAPGEKKPEVAVAQATPMKVEKARDGGLFSGPTSGYPVELHGTELVTPFADVKSVNKKELAQLSPFEFTAPKTRPSSVAPIEAQLASLDKFTTTFLRNIEKAQPKPSTPKDAARPEVTDKLASIFLKNTYKPPTIKIAEADNPVEIKSKPAVTPTPRKEVKTTITRINKMLPPVKALPQPHPVDPSKAVTQLAKAEPKAELRPIPVKDTPHPSPSDFARAVNETTTKKEEVAKAAPQVAPATVKESAPEDMKAFVASMVGQLSEKLDLVIAKLGDSHDTQEKLLQSSRV